MNIKYIYTALLSLSLFFAFGQQNKIGINNDNDIQETVDVGGDMRIANIGTPNNKAIPLGVNENNKVYKLNGANDEFSAIKVISYKINLNQNGSDWAPGVNLNIDSRKYLAVLTQASLVRSSFSTSTTASLNTGAFPKVTIRDNNGNIANEVKVMNGYIKNENGGEVLDSNNHNYGPADNLKYLVAPVQESYLIKRNNSYYFYGDYKDSGPVGGHNFSWVINVMVFDRNWIKTND